MGTLFNADATLYRNFFKEQAKLLGIHVQYQYPIEMDYTLHGQEDPVEYSTPIEMDIIFSESPKLKTLKKLGWISEDPNDKPYMIQVPYDAPNLQKGCLITLPSPLPLTPNRVFKITDITVDQVLPDSWYCKVAPKMEEFKAIKQEDYKNKSFSFLDVNEQPK